MRPHRRRHASHGSVGRRFAGGTPKPGSASPETCPILRGPRSPRPCGLLPLRFAFFPPGSEGKRRVARLRPPPCGSPCAAAPSGNGSSGKNAPSLPAKERAAATFPSPPPLPNRGCPEKPSAPCFPAPRARPRVPSRISRNMPPLRSPRFARLPPPLRIAPCGPPSIIPETKWRRKQSFFPRTGPAPFARIALHRLRGGLFQTESGSSPAPDGTGRRLLLRRAPFSPQEVDFSSAIVNY